ncbi:malate dehydrogenase, NAD-dependent [Thermodesulfatator indicus DSM 15286]|uniref:Malate dehydrogenase n=1 Tax=Thermodesulfatator indicus (strain DSM 15286 / JCM 11887 / CIR29812) TaxID=667014 RepID=F8AA07_THEID|nr:malate dehydrogenase [Thermodesulfatator indicus]AEH45293.1 malate dehydrogenase, NAD-dependent [Thermodesulfatator indicus DSM 15286]
MKRKLGIIGAGAVGTAAAHWAVVKNVAEEVVLVDIVEGLARGKALDIAQSAPVYGFSNRITGTEDWAALKDADVVIITAGRPRKPGMSRDDLLQVNLEIVKSCVENIVPHAPNCCLIVVTNPIDAMVYTAFKVSGFPRERVLGMAGVLDSARYRYFIAEALGVSPKDVQALVMGIHGDHMLPLIRLANVAGIPIRDLLPEEKINEIVERTQKGGAEIVSYLKTGSAFTTPGLSAIEMAEAILRDEKRVLTCSVWLEGEFGVKDVFVGVPVVLGARGLEKVLEFPLTPEEKETFLLSVAEVRKQIEKIGL